MKQGHGRKTQLHEKKAACIKYLQEHVEVPIISALGSGEFAEKIIERAKEENIRIIKDKDFFNFEHTFIPGDEIPESVYSIVANILAAILQTNREFFDE